MPPSEPTIIENHSAPEVYVSHLLRCDLDPGGVAKLTFTSNHMDQDGTSQAVVLRLTLSAPVLESAVQFMASKLDHWKAAFAPPPPETSRH